MSDCDLCQMETDANARTYTPSQIMTAARAGLRPTAERLARSSGALGISQEDAQARWFQRVMTDQNDWTACRACAANVEFYLSAPGAASQTASLPPLPPPTVPNTPTFGTSGAGYNTAQAQATQQWQPPPAPFSSSPLMSAYEDPFLNARTDGFAITSLVLGLIPCACVPSLLAVIFGHIAISRIDGAPMLYKGRTMAMWGLGLGYFFIVCNIIYIIVVATSGGRY